MGVAVNNIDAGDRRREPLLVRAERDENYQSYLRMRSEGTLVHYRVVSGRDGVWETVDGKPCLMFASNDYLGLRWDPRMIAAACRATDHLGTGSAGSRLMAGNSPLHSELESRIADLTAQEEACVFTTGYQANLGAISALMGVGDTVFCDSGVHASLIDGSKLAGATIRPFRRQRIGHLRERLVSETGGLKLMLTDAIYSMEGDILDLDAIASEIEVTPALLHVDEAHSLGVLGPNGCGLSAQSPFKSRVDFVTGTLSKAFASCGGFVAGPRPLIALIRTRARSMLFSTAGAPGSIAAALTAIDLSIAEPERRTQIARNAERLRSGLKREGLSVGDGASQIVPVYIRNRDKAVQVAADLFRRGICAGLAVHPAVPRNASLVRFSTTAAHTASDIDDCVAIVSECVNAVAPEALAA